jgi:hypothetical protein
VGSIPIARSKIPGSGLKRSFTKRSGDILYSLGPKGLFKGCRVFSSSVRSEDILYKTFLEPQYKPQAFFHEPNPNLEKAWIQSLSGNRAIADVESRTDRLRAK